MVSTDSIALRTELDAFIRKTAAVIAPQVEIQREIVQRILQHPHSHYLALGAYFAFGTELSSTSKAQLEADWNTMAFTTASEALLQRSSTFSTTLTALNPAQREMLFRQALLLWPEAARACCAPEDLVWPQVAMKVGLFRDLTAWPEVFDDLMPRLTPEDWADLMPECVKTGLGKANDAPLLERLINGAPHALQDDTGQPQPWALEAFLMTLQNGWFPQCVVLLEQPAFQTSAPATWPRLVELGLLASLDRALAQASEPVQAHWLLESQRRCQPLPQTQALQRHRTLAKVFPIPMSSRRLRS